jgi:hypothetical protein
MDLREALSGLVLGVLLGEDSLVVMPGTKMLGANFLVELPMDLLGRPLWHW